MSIYKYNSNNNKYNTNGIRDCLSRDRPKINSKNHVRLNLLSANENIFDLSLENIQDYIMNLYWKGGIYPPEFIKPIPLTDANGNITHYKILKIPMPTLYTGIHKCYVIEGGTNYASGTTIEFPEPDDIEGVRASGEIVLGFTKDSFNLTDSGTDYSVNDLIFLKNSNMDILGILTVTEVNNSGSIVDYTYDFNIPATGITTGLNTSSIPGNNTSATFEFIEDKYSIYEINITDPGSGYQYYDSVTMELLEGSIEPTINNNISGSGLIISLSQNSFPDPDENFYALNTLDTMKKADKRSNIFFKNKYGEICTSFELYPLLPEIL